MIDILTAILLGLGVIIHPCTIAPNIAAMTFISQREKRSGFSLAMFVVGHTLAYVALGVLLVVLAQKTDVLTSIWKDNNWLHYVLVAVFVVAGLWLIFSSFREHHHHELRHSVLTTPLGAFFSGVAVACLFCPEAAFVFFGMMLPMAISSSAGIAVPVAFSVGTMLPLIVLAFLLVSGKQQLLSRFTVSRPALNRALGIIFLIAAIAMVLF